MDENPYRSPQSEPVAPPFEQRTLQLIAFGIILAVVFALDLRMQFRLGHQIDPLGSIADGTVLALLFLGVERWLNRRPKGDD